MQKFLLLMTAGVLHVPAPAWTQPRCDSHSYPEGVIVSVAAGSVSIVSTSSAKATAVGARAVVAADRVAELQARAALARFISEDIRDRRIVREALRLGAAIEEDTPNNEERISELQQLEIRSAMLLRHTVRLAECYGSAGEVRVSVGLRAASR